MSVVLGLLISGNKANTIKGDIAMEGIVCLYSTTQLIILQVQQTWMLNEPCHIRKCMGVIVGCGSVTICLVVKEGP